MSEKTEQGLVTQLVEALRLCLKSVQASEELGGYVSKAGDDARSALARATLEAVRKADAAEEMYGALDGLTWPKVMSADDVMLLALAGGITGEQQEQIRPHVEKLRAAQEHGRAAIAKAEGRS